MQLIALNPDLAVSHSMFNLSFTSDSITNIFIDSSSTIKILFQPYASSFWSLQSWWVNCRLSLMPLSIPINPDFYHCHQLLKTRLNWLENNRWMLSLKWIQKSPCTFSFLASLILANYFSHIVLKCVYPSMKPAEYSLVEIKSQSIN